MWRSSGTPAHDPRVPRQLCETASHGTQPHTRAVRTLPTLTVAAEAVAVPPAARTSTHTCTSRMADPVWPSPPRHIARHCKLCRSPGEKPTSPGMRPCPHSCPAIAKAALGQISRFALPSPAHPLLPCPHHTRELAAARATPANKPAWRPISLFDGTPQGERHRVLLETTGACAVPECMRLLTTRSFASWPSRRRGASEPPRRGPRAPARSTTSPCTAR